MDRSSPKKPWKSQRDSFKESLIYLDGRRKGKIKSFKTPWDKFDDAGTDGIEWHSTVIVGGRPGTGKTLIKDQIIRESFKRNPGENFRVLEFQLEMFGRVSAIREYSSVLGKSYKYLCSADSPNQYLTDKELEICHRYAKERVKYPIDIIEEPCTTEEFVKIIEQYMEEHATVEEKEDEEIKKYNKLVVTLDHSLLLKKSKHHSNKSDMLYSLGEALTLLKRKYPIIFIILSQLNRGIDSPDRNEEGKYGNYILDSDIFGADALLQHADILVGLNRPAKQKIRWYGPDRYYIENERVLVMHYLKCRNGDVRMSFFKAIFEQMKIVEMETPIQQERKVKAK